VIGDEMTTFRTYLSEAAKARGKAKFRGKDINMKADNKRKYVNSLVLAVVPKIEEALKANGLESFVSSESEALMFQDSYDQFNAQLKKRLDTHGAKFPEDRNDIVSTTMDKLLFSKSTLSWEAKGQVFKFTFAFPVTLKTEIENPEYGDVDSQHGESLHTLMMEYSANRGLRLVGLDTVFQLKGMN